MEEEESIVYFCSEPDCDDRFFSEYQYEIHFIDNHLPTSTFYNCTKCNYTSQRRDAIKGHLVCHYDGLRPHGCSNPGCGASYRYKTDLNNHMKKCTAGAISSANDPEGQGQPEPTTVILTPIQEPVPANQTGAESSDQTQTQQNITCPKQLCFSHFTNQFDFKAHFIREHYPKNPDTQDYNCPEDNCSYKALFPSRLIDHLRTHYPIFPYSCTQPGCNFTCKFRASLERHCRNVHKMVSGSMVFNNPLHRQHGQNQQPQETPTQPQEIQIAPTPPVPPLNLFVCNYSYCGDTFESEYEFKIHLFDHEPKKCNHKCPDCDYTSTVRGSVRNHIVSHYNIQPHKCPEPNCESKYKRFLDLQLHVRQVHDKHIVPPPIPKIKQPPAYVQIYSNRPPESQLVESESQGFFNIEENTTSSTENNDPLEFRTTGQGQGEEFTAPEDEPLILLCTHPGCSETLTSEYELKVHLFNHAPAQPVYNCSDCNYATAVRRSMRRHIVVHYDVTPFTCPEPGCGSAYKYGQVLRLHMIKIHGKRLERRNGMNGGIMSPFGNLNISLGATGSSFLLEEEEESMDLEIGEVVPEPEPEPPVEIPEEPQSQPESEPEPSTFNAICPKPNCNQKQFTSEYEFTLHTFDHNETKSIYHCEVCSYTSYQRAHVRSHLVTHFNVRPHVCPECNASYKFRRDLRDHAKKAHSVILPRMNTSTKIDDFDQIEMEVEESTGTRAENESETETAPPLDEHEDQELHCTHSKPCFRTFPTQLDLKLHLYDHLTIPNPTPPFQCTECDFKSGIRLATRDHLKTHFETQSQKPRTYAASSKQQQAKTPVPVPTEPTVPASPPPGNIFICSICGKSCGNSIAVLNFHMRKAHGRNTSNPKDVPGKKNPSLPVPKSPTAPKLTPLSPTNLTPKNPPKLNPPKLIPQKPITATTAPETSPTPTRTSPRKRKSPQKYSDPSPSFSCDLLDCEETFESEYLLTLHQVDHQLSGTSYKCPKCDAANTNRFNLKEHVASHFKVRPWKCNIESCIAEFKYRQAYRRHMREAHQLNPTKQPRNQFNFLNTKDIDVGSTEEKKVKPKDQLDLDQDQELEFPINCEEESCPKVMNSDYEYNLHQIDHYEHSTRYACPVQTCSHSSPNRYDLKAHVVLHFPVRPFKCPNCPLDFKYKNLMRLHMRRSHNLRSLRPAASAIQSVTLPKKKSSSILHSALLKPNRPKPPSHQPQMLHCKICRRKFSFRSSLKRHLLSVHKIQGSLEPLPPVKAPKNLNGQPQLPCKFCKRFYRTAESLKNHTEKFHRRKFIKNHRNRDRATTQEEEEILSSPDIPPPILSPQVPLFFMPISNNRKKLKRKICYDSEISASSVSTKLQPTDYFLCLYRACGQSFNLELNYRIHTTQHLPDSWNEFECSNCDIVMFEKSNLIEHYSEHYSVEILQCPHCSWKSHNFDEFREHKTTNHPDGDGDNGPEDESMHSEYECRICNLEFESEEELDLHAEETHRFLNQSNEAEGFPCMVCDDVFGDNRSLMEHLKTHDDREN